MLAAAPLVLWILPSDFFDRGGVTVCLSVLIFDIECWGCGLTRAVMHLHHFEFSDAAYFNPLVFLVYPLLVLLWFKLFRFSAHYAGLWPAKWMPVKKERK